MDERDEIRARADLVAIVGREIPLKKRGKNWTGLCPFHPDKNPSFTVNAETGRYRCWSCGAAGDVFNWVMARQNVEFVEALKILAREVGVELKNRPRDDSPDFLTIMEAANAFFRERLTKDREASEYCERRGLDRATLDAWEIGYAPNGRENLTLHLKRAGHSLAVAKELFLTDGEPTGGYSDRFWGRLMIPIRDERGRLVAFGGRVIGDRHPKYVNSGDTPLYRKSRVLFGLNKSRAALMASKHAVLCEGYLDVIAAHRAGVTTAVASLGTALADEQRALLKRWADRVTILYDSDDAGRKAALKAAAALEEDGMPVRIARMPEGDDPDSLTKARGAEALLQVVREADSPLRFRVDDLASRIPKVEPEFWEELSRLLGAERDDLAVQGEIVRLASQYPGFNDPLQAQRALERMVARHRPEPERRRRYDPRPKAPEGPERAVMSGPEFAVFRSLLDEDLRRTAWMFARAADLFVSPDAVFLARAFAEAFPSAPPAGRPSQWLGRLPERAAAIYDDVANDVRFEHVDEAVLKDALLRLRESLAERHERRLQSEANDDEGRNAALQRLRSRKKDPRLATDDAEDGF